jgi:hypothetical protein
LLLLLLFSLSPPFPFSHSPSLPRAHAAVNPDDLEALKQLFESNGSVGKDPATAFEKSWKMFQEPRKQAGRPAGDREGMMETGRLLRQITQRVIVSQTWKSGGGSHENDHG